MPSDAAELASVAGVSRALARARAALVRDVVYHLRLRVPEDAAEPVEGTIDVELTRSAPADLIFDFAGSALRAAAVDGRSISPGMGNEHIVIPARELRDARARITFEFVADASALHRRDGLVYSLFVPARARRVFPCVDQPDVKARFALTLDLPAPWTGVSNGPVRTSETHGDRRVVTFQVTEPLPTYLLAFCAGAIDASRGQRGDRVIHVWYPSRDRAKVDAHFERIVDLHVRALTWLEEYTGVPYPFAKFDAVLIPAFQFSGMEHPGAIYYNAARLLLEPSATEAEQLTRVSLIAHETAHMWFGDLVTMPWFDDVWLKEVFANVMAEKVVAEEWPSLDHDLRFFHANYPGAYAVDRSQGSNAIRQPLDNLADAGQLYGPIIYLKAPIAFRQLEQLMGASAFRAGIRRYLQRHAFGNASWDDLAHELDIAHVVPSGWAEAWIDTPGRPTVPIVRREDGESPDAAGRQFALEVRPDHGDLHAWTQTLALAIGYPDRVEHVEVTVGRQPIRVAIRGEAPAFVLAGGRGWGYGAFPLDADSREWLLAHAWQIGDALTRSVAWSALWDELLDGSVPPRSWLVAALAALAREDDLQNVERLLTYVNRAFWLFLSATERERVATELETCLRDRVTGATTVPARTTWLGGLRQLTVSAEGCSWLEQLWRRQIQVRGLTIGESEELALAMELAVRDVVPFEELTRVQRGRVVSREAAERFDFVVPALSPSPSDREDAFARLLAPAGRTHEPWALLSMQLLNHPLRQAHARQFIRPALERLPEIQRSGDIFFPARWCEALLSGHASPVAAVIVRQFLSNSTGLTPRLSRCVLVAADLLFRAGRPPY